MSVVTQHALSVDAKNLLCPMPIIKLSQSIQLIKVGETLELQATDPGSEQDVKAWARQTNHELVTVQKNDGVFTYYVRRTH